MIRTMFTTLVSLILVSSCSKISSPEDQCISSTRYEALLSSNFEDFDQNPETGWRALPDCYSDIAELIIAYIARNRSELTEDQILILQWHAGQDFALDGNYKSAIEWMEKCFRSGEYYHDVSWNLYVQGTLAFLRKDASTLEKSFVALDALDKSEEGKQTWPGTEFSSNPNTGILSNLMDCMDEPYSIAYSCPYYRATSDKPE